MGTADHILEAATILFNKYGLTRVSLRRIASEVGISHSNLTYHFEDKAVIIDAIYSRMKAEMDDAVYPGGSLSLRHYHDLLVRISEFQTRYRFFYLNLIEIAHHYPKTARRYQKTITERFDQYDRLISHFISRRLVKPEPEPGFYRSLFHSIWVMSTFWLQHRIVLGKRHPIIASGNDIKHVWEILLPYLTVAGLREFRQIALEDPNLTTSRPIQNHYLKRVC